MANAVELQLKVKKQGDGISEVKKDFDKLDKSIDNVNKELKETDKNSKKSSDSLKKFGAGGAAISGVALAIGAATVAMAAFTAKVVEGNNELRKLSTLSGLSIEDFQGFAYMANQVGVDSEAASSALNNLGLRIQEAAKLSSGPAYDAFRKLGISIEDMTKLNPSEQFEALASTLSKLSKAERKFYQDQIASDDLIILDPLIDELDKLKIKRDELKKSGGFISQVESDNINNLNKSYKDLSLQISNSSSKIVDIWSVELIPIIDEITSKIQEMTDKSTGFSSLEKGATVVIHSFNLLYNSIKLIVSGYESLFSVATFGLQSVIYQIDKFNGKDVKPPTLSNEFTKSVNAGRDAIEDFNRSIEAISDKEVTILLKEIKNIETFTDAIKQGFKDGKTELELEADINAGQYYIDSMQKRIESADFKGLDKSVQDKIIKDFEKAKLGFQSRNALEISVGFKTEDFVDINKLESEMNRNLSKIQLEKVKLESGTILEDDFKKEASDLTNANIKIIDDIIKATKDKDLKIKFEIQKETFLKDLVDIERTTSRINSENKVFNDLLLNAEKEILSAKGNINLLSESILDKKIEEIKLNKILTDQEKDILIKKAEGLRDIELANQKIKDLASSLDNEQSVKLNTEVFSDNTEYFNNLENIRQKQMEIEQQNGLTSEASDDMAKKIIEDNKLVEESYTTLAESMAETLTDTVFSVLDGTKSIESAFKDMILSIVTELIKANLTKMFKDMFSGLGGGSSAGGSSTGGIISSIAGMFFHSGGIVGQQGYKKELKPLKYHTGGIAGLKADEVNAVLRKGEEVLTEDDPRHRNNSSGGSSSGSVQIINQIDTNGIAQSLDGNQSFGNAIINYISSNKNEVKNILNT